MIFAHHYIPLSSHSIFVVQLWLLVQVLVQCEHRRNGMGASATAGAEV